MIFLISEAHINSSLYVFTTILDILGILLEGCTGPMSVKSQIWFAVGLEIFFIFIGKGEFSLWYIYNT